jgi:hypothetical protein
LFIFKKTGLVVKVADVLLFLGWFVAVVVAINQRLLKLNQVAVHVMRKLASHLNLGQEKPEDLLFVYLWIFQHLLNLQLNVSVALLRIENAHFLAHHLEMRFEIRLLLRELRGRYV